MVSIKLHCTDSNVFFSLICYHWSWSVKYISKIISKCCENKAICACTLAEHENVHRLEKWNAQMCNTVLRKWNINNDGWKSAKPFLKTQHSKNMMNEKCSLNLFSTIFSVCKTFFRSICESKIAPYFCVLYFDPWWLISLSIFLFQQLIKEFYLICNGLETGFISQISLFCHQFHKQLSIFFTISHGKCFEKSVSVSQLFKKKIPM